jgi:putative acetyltransferase
VDAGVRPALAEDRAAVRRVVEAAFADEGAQVAGLVDALRAAGKVVCELVAEAGGEVVGHVALSRCWVDARDRLVDVLVLSPLAVAPGHQGHGLGAALLAGALEVAAEEGSPAVFLEGSPDYYGRRGFERASRHGFVRPSVRIPDPAFQVALQASYEPWMTGALVYCDPFWAEDCVGLRDPLLAQLEEKLGP